MRYKKFDAKLGDFVAISKEEREEEDNRLERALDEREYLEQKKKRAAERMMAERNMHLQKTGVMRSLFAQLPQRKTDDEETFT